MSAQLSEFSTADFTTFLLNSTLYQKFHALIHLALPYRLQGFLPDRIYFDCERCDRNQAFISRNSRYIDMEPDELESEVQENSLRLMVAHQVAGGDKVVEMINTRAIGFYQLHYACGICHQSDLRWFLEIGRDEQGMFIRKVGQEPAYDIGIPSRDQKASSPGGHSTLQARQNLHQPVIRHRSLHIFKTIGRRPNQSIARKLPE